MPYAMQIYLFIFRIIFVFLTIADNYFFCITDTLVQLYMTWNNCNCLNLNFFAPVGVEHTDTDTFFCQTDTLVQLYMTWNKCNCLNLIFFAPVGAEHNVYPPVLTPYIPLSPCPSSLPISLSHLLANGTS